MQAERIGHGYRIMQDEGAYQKYAIQRKDIHFEACPRSSVMTGSVGVDWKNHPVARYLAYKSNLKTFSIYTKTILLYTECGKYNCLAWIVP